MNKWQTDLKNFRDRIDKIDDKLVSLLNERTTYSKKIGEIKNQYGLELIDYSREIEVINKIVKKSSGIIPEKDLKNIYREIIASSRKIQKSYTISFLGPKGTFSYIVFEKFFGKNTNYDLCKNIREIFLNVVNKDSKFGIVPVENSIEGSVSETLDYLYHFDIKIWAELKLKVSFHLASCYKPDKLRKIYSHPHAIAQCRNFLDKNFPDAKLIPLSSTAEGIKFLNNDKESAAIVSPYSTEIYNLKILYKNIEDVNNSFTRFFVIGKDENNISEGSKTSFIFAVSHQPKSLFKALQIVADNGLNMCKIESRPIKEIPWEYLFFVDIEGKVNDKFYTEFQNNTTFLKKLGTYPVELIE